MSKKLRDHTDEELQAEIARRGLSSTKEEPTVGKEARDEGAPIPTADPTRPGKDMHQPLEGDEVSGLEDPEFQGQMSSQHPYERNPAPQESDGEVGGAVQDDEGENLSEGDQTVDEGDQASEDSEDEEGAPV